MQNIPWYNIASRKPIACLCVCVYARTLQVNFSHWAHILGLVIMVMFDHLMKGLWGHTEQPTGGL